ncbi:GntR family transcriptional regulator [Actinomadura hallensis]|uniref:GntR family transcriptional regulator n=1 Tax=Actinomadura hallensis TaxID=337895 RepID=A0A543IKQ8_9ACTN|nr:GntR family transcriptional regulator [Actinomadura hallensis]TQM71152.1 GntR family transcriptional regulator [Actinomadura hallensis]
MSDDAGYVPKYVRILEALQERIQNGTYPVGERLPSETALVQEFAVSRPTVVRALNDLELLGWIEREHGRGSFVKARPAGEAEERPRMGLAVLDRQESPESVRLVEAGRRSAPGWVAARLGLAEDASVVLRRYVGVHEGITSDLVSLWAPLDIAGKANLGQQGLLTVPVRRLLTVAASGRLVRVKETISARGADEQDAKLLELSPGDPVLSVVASVLDSTGRTVLVAEVALPGTLHELTDSYPI